MNGGTKSTVRKTPSYMKFVEQASNQHHISNSRSERSHTDQSH